MRLAPLSPFLALILAALLAGCLGGGGGSATAPIPTALLPAPAGGGKVLVVVLPGRGDDLDGLRDSGIAAAIQSAWPEADVELAAVTLPYYVDGRMAARLHEEVIAPARARGVETVWLAGASMGGMGALLYDRAHPGAVDGLVLFAPYLADREVLGEIAASGLAGWAPGPVPATLDRDNYMREIWRHVQGWLDSDRDRRVWLAYGRDDRLAPMMPPLASALPPEQVLARDGGHAWAVWTPAAREIFARIGERS